MFRRFPHIAATSLAALALALSACTGSTPTDQQPASQSPKASETAQNSTDPTDPTEREPDPALDSKILTGEVAGVTLEELDQLPNLDDLFEGVDVQLEPADCVKTGITQIGAGATAHTQTGSELLLLSSDAAAPGKYKEFVQKCPSLSGTVSGNPTKRTVEMQQAPSVEGATDVVATKISSESTVEDSSESTNIYQIIGSVNGTTVVAQSTTFTDQAPSPETTTELFKAQVEKLKG